MSNGDVDVLFNTVLIEGVLVVDPDDRPFEASNELGSTIGSTNCGGVELSAGASDRSGCGNGDVIDTELSDADCCCVASEPCASAFVTPSGAVGEPSEAANPLPKS